jgi:hypothetical protein
MTSRIQLLDVVALAHGRPQDNLVRGQVGTVVRTPSSKIYCSRTGVSLPRTACVRLAISALY